MADMDGDSQMGDGTSPSSNSEDAMFPAANTSSSIGVAKSTQVQDGHPSSPPDSQSHAVEQDEPGVGESTMMGEESAGFGSDGMERSVPGSSWDNKKAREEWQRAWGQIEDKQFSLKEFGDPFDESSPENKHLSS